MPPTHQAIQVKGLEQASPSYLGKPLARISDQEFAGLVAMIEAPNYFHPIGNRAAYAARLVRVQSVVAGRCTPTPLMMKPLQLSQKREGRKRLFRAISTNS